MLSTPSLLLESSISNCKSNILKAFLELFSPTASFFQYSAENVDTQALSSSPLEASPMSFAKEKSHYCKLFPSLLTQESHSALFLY